MECNIICKQSLLPVTSLEFCSVAGTCFLLAGEGPYLKIFSQDGSLLVQEEVFPFKVVHGIRLAWGCESGALILIFGQKSLRIVEVVRHEQSGLRLTYRTDVIELSDWILDARLQAYKEDSSHFEITAITAHNVVVVYSTSTGRLASFLNEYNCILYSARLLGSSVERSVIASGTVFNQILLWHLEENKPFSPPSSSSSSLARRVQVQLILSGHEGVIFSIRFSEDESQLVSASDDRTVRVWNLPTDWKILNKVQQRSCALVLYGHTARVWDARLLPSCVVSIGEDTTCKVWDHQGLCVETVEGHKGRNIWSLAVDVENSLVATGGGDCSIRVFTLKLPHQHNSEWVVDSKLPYSSSANKPDTPRSVQLCGQTALCLSSNGFLFAADLASVTVHCDWAEVHHDPEFSGYSIMAISQSQQLLALGNLRGYIKLLKVDDRGACTVELMWLAHDGKVFSLTWTSAVSNGVSESIVPRNLLFSCGPDGELVCWNVEHKVSDTFAVSKLACFSLPPSKHRWVSSVLVLQDSDTDADTSKDGTSIKHDTSGGQTETHFYIVVCGDRKGSLHVYGSRLLTIGHLQEESHAEKCLEPLQSLFGIHGPNGVTCVTFHNGYIFTAGRDGYSRQFSLNHSCGLTELTKFKPVKDMGWIEQLMFTEEDLLVLGFHTTDLVLFSRNQNKHVVKISCGGGHRSYGFSSKEQIFKSKAVHAVYIKQSVLCLRRINLHAYFSKPVLQQAFVGREALSLEVLHSDPTSGADLIAVGSEDCTICLLALQPSPDTGFHSLRVLKVLQGHISSVKALSSSQSCLGGSCKLLFSGGARASLKVWQILEVQKEPVVTLKAELFLHSSSLRLRKPKRKRKSNEAEAPPECRVMSLTSFPLSEMYTRCESHSFIGNCHYVAAGCSDGMIRQYIYGEEGREFSELRPPLSHTRCVTVVEHFFHRSCSSPKEGDRPAQSSAFLCSSATDGKVAVWSLNSCITEWVQSMTVPTVSAETNASQEDSTTVRVLQEECLLTAKTSLAGASLSANTGSGCNSPTVVFQAHQSGINDIAISSHVGDGCYTIATVGDDNALVVSLCKLVCLDSFSPTFTVEHQFSEPSGHSSSITGVKFLHPNTLVTTSIDQRINTWQIVGSASEKPLRLASSHFHDVADTAALQLFHTRDYAVLLLCGVGFQYYCLQFRSTEQI